MNDSKLRSELDAMMNASPEPPELSDYWYVLSKTASWRTVNPIKKRKANKSTKKQHATKSLKNGVTDSTPVIVSGPRGLSDGMRIVAVD